MRKDDLILWLKSVPGNPEVLLASDAEGNSYSSLSDGSEEFAPKDYEGWMTEEIFAREDLVDEADPDEAVLEDFKGVIVLWPV